ncbi:MAG: VPS10 domain-containing protein [Candidatus Kryptoniota bacterium]
MKHILIFFAVIAVVSPLKAQKDNDAIKFLRIIPSELTKVKYVREPLLLPKVEAANWVAIGPQPVNLLYGRDSSSGRVSSVSVDPLNPNIVYAAAAGGGLWKTTDGGNTWTPLTDNLPRLSSGCVAVDQVNDQIVYYGQGELHYSIDSYPGSGLYISRDGGQNWQQVSLPGGIYYTGKIAIAPSNDSVIYVCGYYDIYRSTDLGKTWTELNLVPGRYGAVQDVAIDPSDPFTIYAARGSYYSSSSDTSFGVFKSTDGGMSWFKQSTGLPPSGQIQRIQIAISQSNKQILYASVYGTNPLKSGQDTTRAYKSTNGGQSWNSLPVNVDYGGGQGWYNNFVAVDPTNPNIVYLGGVDLWKSTDGGQSWSNYTRAYTTGTVHPDQHSMSFQAGNGNVFYLGNDGGVWKTLNGGAQFSSCNSNLQITQFYAVGIDPSNPLYTYGGTQDNGTERNLSPAMSWDEIYSGDGGYVTIDPQNPSVIYGEYVNGALAKSTDGGKNFNTITNGISEKGYWTQPYVMDPNNTGILYTATDKIYWTSNGGNNWFVRSNGYLKAKGQLVTTMSLSPVEPNVIYAGISGYRGGSGSNFLYVSKDSGKTWTDITVNGDTSADFARVTADPEKMGVAYVAMLKFPFVMKTTDYGQTWTPLTTTINGFGSQALAKIVCIDSITGNIYVGTYQGVYFSSDTGNTWSRLGTGLPNAVVDDIAIQYSAHSLRIATHGRGVWRVDLATGIATPEVRPEEFEIGQNYPNPFNPSTLISYRLPSESYVTLRVYDILGREIKTLFNGRQNKGDHNVNFDASALPSGVYFYRISVQPLAGDQQPLTAVRKMTLLK